MFFKKFFDKTFKHYLQKGDKYFQEGRYADSRHAYLEALQKLDTSDDRIADERSAQEGLTSCGNKLALLNIAEAEFAGSLGEVEKAREHLKLALELAHDPTIREQAKQVERALGEPVVVPQPARKSHSCGGCGGGDHAAHAGDDQSHDELLADDRFAFLLHTLPEPLAKRYAAMGEKFAEAYLASHEGDEGYGLKLYLELLRVEESDILLYEAAIIHFRRANHAECERMLRRALIINPANELCHLGLVQLLIETGRAPESVGLLQHMVENQMMEGQASIILGDVYLLLGEEAKAMDTLVPALQTKAIAKAAAERLVPLLEAQNRQEEAAYLFKTHMKGCC